MQSERRDLEYFGKGLTDEQVVEKKRMLKESAEMLSLSGKMHATLMFEVSTFGLHILGTIDFFPCFTPP